MLEIKGLNQFYGDSHILWDIALQAVEGSCLCVLGRNGVGKTTLLKTIMGLLPARGGSIMFRGQDLIRQPVPVRARLGIGYVPQGREIFPLLTVEENLRVGLGYRAKVPPLIFELFPVLQSMLHRRGGDLSGGQQQQLAIGRALACKPRLLILDEPTEGIQPNIVREIGEIIRRLNREARIGVLLVEQKLAFARRVAENFCLMDKGRVVALGPIGELSEEMVGQHLSV
ncbi:MAG: urea ABC transporter ATP-binding subunit UrtE [Pseudomonadota bacterium]